MYEDHERQSRTARQTTQVLPDKQGYTSDPDSQQLVYNIQPYNLCNINFTNFFATLLYATQVNDILVTRFNDIESDTLLDKRLTNGLLRVFIVTVQS